MSSYKRANWHSGLTYQRQCDQCKTIVRYRDYSLDYRPWYADGFIYCPKCNLPLRHNEKYAIDGPVANQESPEPQQASAPTQKAAFCSSCGYKFCDGDAFCPHCGKKR